MTLNNGDDALVEGIVVRVDSHFPLIESAGARYRCSLRKKLKRGHRTSTHKVCVGDRVLFAPPTSDKDSGVIEKILPRNTQLIRRASHRDGMAQAVVANVDRLIVVASARQPHLNPRLIDRMLVAGENGALECIICINKMDLAKRDEVLPLVSYYPKLNYSLIFTSAKTGEGLNELKDALRNKSSVFAGASGVGKSTLLNAIQPGLKLTVREVSEATGKGKHTTSFVQLLRLDFGGYVVDTPGIREFGLWDMDKHDLQYFFPEMQPFIGRCKYADCTHTHEPQCAVKAAVEAGNITRARYESYVHILETVQVKGHR
jgi:ribosome biogenesis GTPase